MTVLTTRLIMSTVGNMDIHDIKNDVSSAVQKTNIQDGIVTIFCPSATSGLTTIEYESGCLKDLQRTFDELVNPDRPYKHNQRWGDGNGHSHIRAALLGPSLTVPFSDRKLTLGTWQQIIFVDFDNRPRERELVIQIMGD